MCAARTRKRSNRTYMCRPPCDLCTSATVTPVREIRHTEIGLISVYTLRPKGRGSKNFLAFHHREASAADRPLVNHHLRCIAGECTHSFSLPGRSRRWLVHTLCLPEGVNHRACRVRPYRPGRQVAPAVIQRCLDAAVGSTAHRLYTYWRPLPSRDLAPCGRGGPSVVDVM